MKYEIEVSGVKLYQEDQEILNFSTRIKSVWEDESGVMITLLKSYFYPEGGGQPADRGTINGKEVLDVKEKDGEIHHRLASFSGLTINMPVECTIDKETREDHSIQHTGQHVLTAVLKDVHGIETLSFHMGRLYSTIDTDQEISHELALSVEKAVNDRIGEDLPVSIYYRDKWNLQGLPLRKPVQVDSDIRIVQIGEMDWCGCGGTHVKSLKELRIFKITSVEKYKGGSRIYYMAGERAFHYLTELEEILLKLKEELAVNLDEIPYRVVRLREERDEYRKSAEAMMEQLGEALARGYVEDIVVEEVVHGDDLIKVIGNCMVKDGKIGVFYRRDGRVYIFTGNKTDAKKIVNTAREGLMFRGGGGQTLQQGFIEREEEIGLFISRVYDALLDLEL